MRSSTKYPNITTEKLFNTALKHRGNLVEVARELGIKNRSTVYDWLERHNLIIKLRQMTGQAPAPTVQDQIAIDSTEIGRAHV